MPQSLDREYIARRHSIGPRGQFFTSSTVQVEWVEQSLASPAGTHEFSSSWCIWYPKPFETSLAPLRLSIVNVASTGVECRVENRQRFLVSRRSRAFAN